MAIDKEFLKQETLSLHSKQFCIHACTTQARVLAKHLATAFQEQDFLVEFSEEGTKTKNWFEEHWTQDKVLVFIGSTGIALRCSAEKLQSKLCDPAVIVIDELGKFVIPLLSGHLGQASACAELITAFLPEAQCVHTTASDARSSLSVDRWASAMGHCIENPSSLKDINAAQLRGERLGVAVSDLAIETPFDLTCYVRPQSLVLGIGCTSSATEEQLIDFVEHSCTEQGISLVSVTQFASHSCKQEQKALIKMAKHFGKPIEFYASSQLKEVNSHTSSSEWVKSVLGVDSVCEQAALYAAGKGSQLVFPKQVRSSCATLACARKAPHYYHDIKQHYAGLQSGLIVAGIGPGSYLDMSIRCKEALAQAEYLVGYTRYVELVKDFVPFSCKFVSTAMRGEISRCKQALDLAKSGKRVVMVCSGDSGVYGMASLIYELKDELSKLDASYAALPIELIPGITSSIACASMVGAPLANDFCTLSLSDLLTPHELIMKRLEAAAASDLCIVLYNPRSKKRQEQLTQAIEIVSRYREASTCVCAWVKHCGREEEDFGLCMLDELDSQDIDMFTTVFIGSSSTRLMGDKMVTTRGYHTKTEFQDELLKLHTSEASKGDVLSEKE